VNKNRSIFAKGNVNLLGKKFNCISLLYFTVSLTIGRGDMQLCTVFHLADFIYVHVEQISFKSLDRLGENT